MVYSQIKHKYTEHKIACWKDTMLSVIPSQSYIATLTARRQEFSFQREIPQQVAECEISTPPKKEKTITKCVYEKRNV